MDTIDPSQRSSVQHLRDAVPAGTGPSRVTATDEAPPSLEQKKMHPIFSKASLSKERRRESENFSKNPSSSDSSFQQQFELLIRESESLKWQLEKILLNRLTPQDPVYSEFVDKVISKNIER